MEKGEIFYLFYKAARREVSLSPEWRTADGAIPHHAAVQEEHNTWWQNG